MARGRGGTGPQRLLAIWVVQYRGGSLDAHVDGHVGVAVQLGFIAHLMRTRLPCRAQGRSRADPEPPGCCWVIQVYRCTGNPSPDSSRAVDPSSHRSRQLHCVGLHRAARLCLVGSPGSRNSGRKAARKSATIWSATGMAACWSSRWSAASMRTCYFFGDEWGLFPDDETVLEWERDEGYQWGTAR